jgi:Tol biopolymer transport system component
VTDKSLDTTYADLFDGHDDGLATLIADLDALYSAPTPPANMQTRFEHLLRQRSEPARNGRESTLSGAIPPTSRATLPPAQPDFTPIPLSARTRLRQIGGIAAAILLFAMVAIVLARMFGAGGDDDGQQAAPVDATPTATVGEILYVGWPENRSEERSEFALFVARADGSGVRQIGEATRGHIGIPSWSPDGSRIAFSSDVETGPIRSVLYVMDADGGNLRRLTDGSAAVVSVVWSPDGSRIAFVSTENRMNTDIYVTNADGTELRRLPGSDNALELRWSPDERRIAFTQLEASGSMQLVVVNSDGTEPRRLETPFRLVGFHEWAPDGSRIVFIGIENEIENETRSIYVISPDGSNLTRLTHGPSDWTPRWSPDGREIAFTRASEDEARIHVMQADGSGERVLVDAWATSPVWSPDGSQIAIIMGRDPQAVAQGSFVGARLSVVNRDGSGLQVLADNFFSSRWTVSWRLVPADTAVSTPTMTPEPVATPTPAPSDDLAARASRSPFPEAEVLHVVQIAEQQGPDGETHTFDTWIDQTTGDVVVWQTAMDGEPRALTVRQGTTVVEAEAGVEGWTSLSITSMLRADDPNLGYPLNHLHDFRDLLARGSGELEDRGITVDQSATFRGQPAIELIIPVRDAEQLIGTITAYLDPQTLYPIATLVNGVGQAFSYPTIEPLALADVPAGTFDPPLPDAIFTYIREAIAPEAASSFDAYPLWWLGEQFSGYTLQVIERYRASGPDDIQPDRDYMTVIYLAGPNNDDDQLQIISQPPLSDIDWAHRDANHSVHGYEELEIGGNRAWLHPDGSQIEIAFPDSYVTINAPNLALAAAEALQQANAPDASHEGTVQTIEDAMLHVETIALGRSIDDTPPQIVRVQRMRLAEALERGRWASQNPTRQDQPDDLIWEIEVANTWLPHSCPAGATIHECNWQHLTYLISAETGEMIGLRYADWMLTDTLDDDPPLIPADADLRTIDDALRHVHDLAPGADGQPARVVNGRILTAADTWVNQSGGTPLSVSEDTALWQIDVVDAQYEYPCPTPLSNTGTCVATSVSFLLRADTGAMLAWSGD